MKKAQAAMEFLMTYGWAILVVLIAIGALAYFGVLSPERFLPEKCVISTGSGLFCDAFSIDDANTVRLNIKNILTDSVDVTAVTLTNGAAGGSCLLDVAISPNPDPDPIPADGIGLATLDCTADSLDEKVKADLSITYTVGTFTKTTTGTLTGVVP